MDSRSLHVRTVKALLPRPGIENSSDRRTLVKCYLSTRQRNVKDLEFEVDNRTVKDAFDNISKFRYIPFFL